MRRDYVASSNIKSVGYDQSSQTLEVEFQNSFVYQYYNVPSQVYDALMAAPSKGQFLNSQIKRLLKNFFGVSSLRENAEEFGIIVVDFHCLSLPLDEISIP